MNDNNENITTRSRSEQSISNVEELHVGSEFGTEEARYNLATRVMSNGVEVIVASDKSTLPGGQPNLRILSTTEHYRLPLTLPPSTLMNHMMLVVPTENKPNRKSSIYLQATQVNSNSQTSNSFGIQFFMLK